MGLEVCMRWRVRWNEWRPSISETRELEGWFWWSVLRGGIGEGKAVKGGGV